jgi:hypothetical protein
MFTKVDYELNLEPSDVKFLEILKQGEYSAVFKVLVRLEIRVLKVVCILIHLVACQALT